MKKTKAKKKSVAPKQKKKIPFSFVLEELADLPIYTKPMFGCLGIYLDEKIVLILRDREDHPRDNGIWLATDQTHHTSLRKQIPSLRSIEIFGPGETAWQNLPSMEEEFEESALFVCSLIHKRDERIGRVPKKRKPKKQKSRTVR
ncbi:MAG: TfoX/Sxy family protein [Oligoflexia bacterium]|nr:TfoX/Sxy family protein [Oligoflexia bacterium]